MILQQIENIIFQNKTKDQLIEDTLASLSGLLSDVFTGDDVNELKKELPEGIKLEDISIQLKHTAIYLDSKDFPIPSIEIAIDIVQEKTKYEIGMYSLIFDENCEQIDEVFIYN